MSTAMLYSVEPLGRSGRSGMARLTCALSEPRVVLGSNGAPENSRRRSSASNSAAAGTGPSTRSRTRAGGATGRVSGTSNTPLEMASLRPGDTSTLPLPSVMVEVRPVTRTLRSASRIAGRPATGRSATPLPTISTDSPSSGIGGPLAGNVASGALVAMSRRSTVPLMMCCNTQSRTFGATNTGHSRFMAPNRHLAAGNSDRQPRLGAIIEIT